MSSTPAHVPLLDDCDECQDVRYGIRRGMEQAGRGECVPMDFSQYLDD